MRYGRANFKLPFPEVEQKLLSRHWRPWTRDGIAIPGPKFHDTKGSRGNWKRFKRLCRLLKTAELQYSVQFHFELIGLRHDACSGFKPVEGVRAELIWRDGTR